MKKRILIAPNSFKECADSVVIAELIRDNLSTLNNTELIVKPISDGGDGFLNVCRYYFGGEIRKYTVTTSFDSSKFECPVLFCNSKNEIFIESADAFGLKVVPLVKRNPIKLTSKGLGELLINISRDVQAGIIDVERIFIGIGGTATIDMGMGIMSELGLQFFDSENTELIMLPENFLQVKYIRYEPLRFPFEIIPVIDVGNPLLGNDNGILVYGKQKGANQTTILELIKSFNYLLNLLKNNRLAINTQSLSGAGGGLPTAFQLFYNSVPLTSNEFIRMNLGIESYVDKIEYLIAGEGSFDYQSSFGKGAGNLIKMFSENVKKIFLICGRISKDSLQSHPNNVIPIELSKYFENPSNSLTKYEEGLYKACKQIINEINF